MDSALNKFNLSSLIERGGVYHDINGTNPKELVTALIELIPPVSGLDKKFLINAVMEREALVSTGIGRGIALPHPRSPVFTASPMVLLAFPVQPIDWKSPDGGKIHTVFLILSASAKQHIGTLSEINFLSKQENFYTLLQKHASKEEIIKEILKAESSWTEKE